VIVQLSIIIKKKPSTNSRALDTQIVKKVTWKLFLCSKKAHKPRTKEAFTSDELFNQTSLECCPVKNKNIKGFTKYN
jgi:hypothetical protein